MFPPRPPVPPHTPTVKPVEEFVPLNGISFRTTWWHVPTEEKFKARIVFVHAYLEHVELYYRVCDLLAQRGYECFIFDQRGFGMTLPGAAKGVTDEHHTFADLDAVLSHVKATPAPNDKLFMFGHLLGAAIILNYCVTGKHRDSFSGCVLQSPLIHVHERTLPPAMLVGALRQVVRFASFIRFNPKVNVDYMVHPGKWYDYCARDLFLRVTGTLKHLRDMLDRGFRLTDAEFLKGFHPDIPVLITHAKYDYINDIDGLWHFIALVPLQKVELVTYRESRHCMHLEGKAIYDQWLGDIEQFLDQHR